MRDLINIINRLLQESAVSESLTPDELENMKAVIASKIKELPDDDVTAKALKEIEDLLKNLHAGGKWGIINGELKAINDPSVDAAQKLLARYIISLDMAPDQREELFNLWRTDKLINRKKLLSPGKKTFSDIINKYDSNPVIAELVNDLMHISFLGQGKGEFGLSVLSKSITKQEGKGDLSIDGRAIEVKTTDGGAGRFTDQEVRPGPGFEQAARELNKFVSMDPDTPLRLPGSGLSLSAAVEFAERTREKAKFLKMVGNVIALIFGGDRAMAAPIVAAIKSGDKGAALQEYAKASFNYYMGKKEDEGVLYINLVKKPITTVYFKDANELEKSALRLHSGTVYLTSIADIRLPYPQMEIVDTSFGANAKQKAEKDAAKAAAKAERAAKAAAKLKPSTLTGKRVAIRPPGIKRSAPAGVGRAKR